MRPTTRTTALTALAISACSLSALAGAPAALDRVPDNAEVVVSIAKLSDFLSDIDAVNTALGEKSKPELMFVTSMVRGMPGVNLDGSALIVLDLPADPNAGEEPTVVALVPVADFAAFSQGRQAVDGLVEMPFPDQHVFARDLGQGLAALSDNPDTVRAYDATKGHLKGHTARLGGAGNRVLDNAEVSVLINADAARPYLDQMLAGIKEQGPMVGMMGGEQAIAGFNSFATLLTSTINDLGAGAFGLTINDKGMSYDLGFQFKEGTGTASMFVAGGKTAGLLEHLPAGPYMFASALDTSSPAVAKFGAAMEAWKAQLPDELKKQMGMGFGQMSMKDLHELSSGVAFVMGTTPGLMGGGLFSNTTKYVKTDKPDAFRQALVTLMNEANGMSNKGVTVNTTVSPDAVTIDGTALTSYAVSFKVDPNAMGSQMGAMGVDPTMAMQMIFGPNGGPSGYLAEVNGGFVQTLSQGPDLTKKALAAAKNAQGLGANERVARVSKALQDGRIAEVYIGVDEILNAVGPMLMMFGAVPEFQPVQAMDPIAFGVTSDAGGFTTRTHIPMATFKAIAALVPADAVEQQDDDGFDF